MLYFLFCYFKKFLSSAQNFLFFHLSCPSSLTQLQWLFKSPCLLVPTCGSSAGLFLSTVSSRDYVLSFLPCQTLCVPEQRPKQKMPAPGLGMLCTPPGSQTVELISGVIRRWARLGAIQVSSSSRLVLDASAWTGPLPPTGLGISAE